MERAERMGTKRSSFLSASLGSINGGMRDAVRNESYVHNYGDNTERVCMVVTGVRSVETRESAGVWPTCTGASSTGEKSTNQ
ncbi:hypothetical protein J6590_013297 [Homalodisca vitripennis]|nr:hypothetical protein J6590_013297 [Homalodisca vitripennis]